MAPGEGEGAEEAATLDGVHTSEFWSSLAQAASLLRVDPAAGASGLSEGEGEGTAVALAAAAARLAWIAAVPPAQRVRTSVD